MKPKLIEIANILWRIPDMNKNYLIGIINPLDTIEQADKMLEWLNSQDEIRIDHAIDMALQIRREG